MSNEISTSWKISFDPPTTKALQSLPVISSDTSINNGVPCVKGIPVHDVLNYLSNSPAEFPGLSHSEVSAALEFSSLILQSTSSLEPADSLSSHLQKCGQVRSERKRAATSENLRKARERKAQLRREIQTDTL